MTLNTRMVQLVVHKNNTPWIEVSGGLRIQVLPDVSYLARCQKHQFAAFIANTRVLVVWDDDPKQVLQRAENLEKQLLRTLWGNESAYPAEEDAKETLSLEGVDYDTEDSNKERSRAVVLIQPVLTAITIVLCMVAVGAGWGRIAQQLVVDQNWVRVLFIFCYVPQTWLALVSSGRTPFDTCKMLIRCHSSSFRHWSTTSRNFSVQSHV